MSSANLVPKLAHAWREQKAAHVQGRTTPCFECRSELYDQRLTVPLVACHCIVGIFCGPCMGRYTTALFTNASDSLSPATRRLAEHYKRGDPFECIECGRRVTTSTAYLSVSTTTPGHLCEACAAALRSELTL